MEEFFRQTAELWWGLAIFALAFPFERAFGTGQRPAVSERIGNLGAMVIHFVLGGLVLQAVLAWPVVADRMNIPEHPRLAALENPLLYGLCAMFLVDALYYVYHRLQHAVPLLWRIHALHHSDPAVNITTARRTHFLERPIQFLVLVTPVLYLLGWNDEGLAMLAIAGPVLLFFSHMDIRLSLGALTPVIVGPQYHRLHHARDSHRHGANFAQAFPIFDVLGGTYRRPAEGEFVTTGIEGCNTALARWRPAIW